MNDQPKLVVQSTESYQALLDRVERAETVAAIREGIAQCERGEGIPLEEAMNRIRKKLGFSAMRPVIAR